MKTTKMLLSVALTLISVATFAGITLGSTIDFTTSPASYGLVVSPGTVSWGGSTDSLIGSGIIIGSVNATGVPLNGGFFYGVSGPLNGYGVLNFTTGPYTSFNPTTDVYTFSSGGSLTITGYVSAAGESTDTTLVDSTAVSGTFDAVTGGVSLTTLNGPDTKDPTLVGFFGLPSTTVWNLSNATVKTDITGAFTQGGSFTSTDALSTDISNAAVPEPATMLLFGFGLFGAGVFARKRFAKK